MLNFRTMLFLGLFLHFNSIFYLKIYYKLVLRSWDILYIY